MLRDQIERRQCNPLSVKLRHTDKICYHIFMLSFKVFVFIGLLILGIYALYAQDEPIRVESSLVRLNVGVVDQKGRPITSLNKGSFDLYEDGIKQEITRFEPSETPFSVAILLDMSGSTLSF